MSITGKNRTQSESKKMHQRSWSRCVHTPNITCVVIEIMVSMGIRTLNLVYMATAKRAYTVNALFMVISM